MAEIRIWRGGDMIASRRGENEVNFQFLGAYEPGDEIEFVADTRESWVRVDAAVAPARVYLPKGSFRYRVPLLGDGLFPYPPGAFLGEKHLLSLRPAVGDEYRNLAANPADQHDPSGAYPHASANVETRGESVFFARNVIDGEHIADGHGRWPYGSWGVGARADAFLTIEFGRPVRVDALILYLRADFPHDAHWISGVAAFSDGSEIAFPLQKKDGAQKIMFPEKTIEWVRLERLVKNDDPSAFPSLRQLEAWGRGEPIAR